MGRLMGSAWLREWGRRGHSSGAGGVDRCTRRWVEDYRDSIIWVVCTERYG